MFVSYAQNFEDVMLWRALKGVESGFYIDIGAQDPVSDSVSKAFHDLGWRGVHVEPTADYAQRLREEREGDPVLQAIVGPATDQSVIYQIEGTGLSTTVAELARQHAGNNFKIEKGMSTTSHSTSCSICTRIARSIGSRSTRKEARLLFSPLGKNPRFALGSLSSKASTHSPTRLTAMRGKKRFSQWDMNLRTLTA